MGKAASFCVAALLFCAPLSADDSLVEPTAAAIIAQTRETRATYSVYYWNVITISGSPVQEEWSAEFHSGSLHRVETPRDRIIADCSTEAGVYLNVVTGEVIRGPQVARTACGIQANSAILEARVIARESGKFGPVARVLIRDPENVRSYDVAANGALVAATIDDLESRRLLKMYAVHIDTKVRNDIFSEESLNFSAVPALYRSKIR